MKIVTLIFITLAMIIAKITVAQTKDTSSMLNGKFKIISTIKDGEKKSSSISLSTKKDSVRETLETSWGSFDIGFNNYQDKTDYGSINSIQPNTNSLYLRMQNPSKEDFELRTGKSININIGIVKAQLSLYKHYINLVSGITYDINNWSYSSSLNWNKPISPTLQQPELQVDYFTRDSLPYKKNKIVTNYLQVPLLLRFETSPNHEKKNVYISAGGYAGYLVRVHTKQIYKGSDQKIKQHNDFNITKFQYGAQFEIGYRGTCLFFKKAFTPLFATGTIQYPYSFGLRLTGL